MSEKIKQSKLHIFLTKDTTLLVLTIISAVATTLYACLKTAYIFVDITVFKGLSITLLCLAIICTLTLATLYIISKKDLKNKNKKIADGTPFFITSIISAVYTAFILLYDIVNSLFSIETLKVYVKMFKSLFPIAFAIFFVMFLALIVPHFKSKKVKCAISVTLSIIMLGYAVINIFPINPYKITSDPMVIDNGKTYSVVFATNSNGTGYVEYKYDGKDYLVYDENEGRLNCNSKIHTVSVPKEHLIDNKYRIGSKRIIEDLSYGGRSGKNIVSDYYTFNIPTGSEQTYLTVSDWHSMNKKAFDAIDYVGDYNGIVLFGDASLGLMFEDEIKEYIVEFGGELSKGSMPVIFMRRNHETRGAEASRLSEYLGMDSYYYTTSYGNFNFIALDSGEDKEDTHPEYGEMVNYSQYRQEMVEWLETLPKSDKKTIAFVHSKDICIEPELNERVYAQLERLGVNQIISGHTHVCEFMEENNMKIYVDGGFNKNKFIASKLIFNENDYTIEAWNNTGSKVFEKTLNW